MANQDFSISTPVAPDGFDIHFQGLPAPRPRVIRRREKKPVYQSADGSPTFDRTSRRARRQKTTTIDGETVPLWLDPVTGEETPNRWHTNEDGERSKNEPAAETYEDWHEWEEKVTIDGEQQYDYATMNGRIHAVGPDRQRLPVSPRIDYDDLTDEERSGLQEIFLAAYTRKLVALGVKYASRAEAEAAGAFNG